MRLLGCVLAGMLLSCAIPIASAAEQMPESKTEQATSTVPFFDMTMLTDTDGDGLSDEWEQKIFQTNPQKKDTDGDIFADGNEIRDFFDPLKKKAAKTFGDADKDGLDDRLEWLFKTNPFDADTDDDGFIDGDEVTRGFDPRSSNPEPLKKRISITLSKQIMKQELDGIALASFRVSTGRPGMATPVGEFAIKEKHPRAWSRSAKLWMPYWMKFTDRGHGIHELPEWPGGKKEGMNHLGIAVSHGCVRLGIGPAKTMYEWATVGTPIHIER